MLLEKYLNAGTVTTLFIGMMLFGNALQAKGLDALTPGPDAEETKNDAPEVQKPKTPADSNIAEPQKQDASTQSDLEEKETVPPVKSEESIKPPEVTSEQPKPVERSAASLALENKLHLNVGLGLGKLAGKSGAWGNKGSGSLGAGYLIWDKSSGKRPLFIEFNYRPFDTVVKYQGQTYRGITEGFFGGVKHFHQLKENLFAAGALEIGYIKNRVISTDYLKESSKLGRADLMLAASGSLEWKLRDKILLGPQILFGSGSEYTLYKLGASTSFIF